jgi:hypothetical protein
MTKHATTVDRAMTEAKAGGATFLFFGGKEDGSGGETFLISEAARELDVSAGTSSHLGAGRETYTRLGFSHLSRGRVATLQRGKGSRAQVRRIVKA